MTSLHEEETIPIKSQGAMSGETAFLIALDCPDIGVKHSQVYTL